MSKHRKKNAPDQKQEAATESIGSYLQKLRTEKGLSIKDVTEATPISATNINAIEAQDFGALPADTFMRGLVSMYANFLGADPAYILDQFMQARDDARQAGHHSRSRRPQKILAPKALAEPARISSAAMASIFLVLIIVLFTTFCLYTSWNPFTFMTKKTDRFQVVMLNALNGNKPAASQDEKKNEEIPSPLDSDDQ